MFLGFPCRAVVKNLPASAGDTKDVGLIPESGTSLGEGNGYPLQYSWLSMGSPMVPWTEEPGSLWPIACMYVYIYRERAYNLYMEVSFLSGVQVLQKIILLEIKIIPGLGLPNCGFKPRSQKNFQVNLLHALTFC